MTDVTPTPDNHPSQRAGDKGFKGRLQSWWGQGRGYRDIWLLAICIAIYFAFQANADQDQAIQQQRVEATALSCAKFNEGANATNAEFTVLQALVISGAALPGDTTKPAGEKNPTKWKSIEPGPLSDQLAQQFPGFPDAQERLKNAEASADKLEEKKVALRGCEGEVKKLVELINEEAGIEVSPVPIPTQVPTPASG
jgi:hypothetical protein